MYIWPTQPLLLLSHQVKYYSIKLRDLHCGFIETGRKHSIFLVALFLLFEIVSKANLEIPSIPSCSAVDRTLYSADKQKLRCGPPHLSAIQTSCHCISIPPSHLLHWRITLLIKGQSSSYS